MAIPTAYKKQITDDLVAGTLKAAVLKASTYSYSAAHTVWADVSAHACVGQPAGGWSVTGGASVASGTDYIFDAADISSGTGQTITDIGYVVVYDTADGNRIRCIKTVSPTVSVTSGTLTIQWNATNGIIKVSS